MFKFCVTCKQQKPWNPTARTNRKASGFHGNNCWSCFLKLASQNPEYQAAYRSAYRNQRYSLDSLFAARCRMSAMSAYIVRRLSNKLQVKDATVAKVFGCTTKELCAHIEAQFSSNTNWSTYGNWELDHIIPISSAKTIIELLALYHVTNTQVLAKQVNRQKAAA